MTLPFYSSSRLASPISPSNLQNLPTFSSNRISKNHGRSHANGLEKVGGILQNLVGNIIQHSISLELDLVPNSLIDFHAQLFELEKTIKVILLDYEKEWNLRIQVIWLSGRDGSKKYFHRVASHRKTINTYWVITGPSNVFTTLFSDIGREGCSCFKGILK